MVHEGDIAAIGRPISILADENVPKPISDRLRSEGWIVTAIVDLEPGAPDEKVLLLAIRGDQMLLTCDRDFGELAISQGLPVKGVVLIELERFSLASQAERVSAVLKEFESDFVGRFTVIEPGRVRRRALTGSVKGA